VLYKHCGNHLQVYLANTGWFGAKKKKKKTRSLAYVLSTQQQESCVDRNMLSTVALPNKFRYNVEIDRVRG